MKARRQKRSIDEALEDFEDQQAREEWEAARAASNRDNHPPEPALPPTAHEGGEVLLQPETLSPAEIAARLNRRQRSIHQPTQKRRITNREDFVPGDTVRYAEEVTVEKIRRDLLHFCCHTCGCEPARVAKYCHNAHQGVFQTSRDHLWHRMCCHRISNPSGETAVPIDKIMLQRQENLENEVQEQVLAPEYHPREAVINMFRNAKRQEAQLGNANVDDDNPISRLHTSDDYQKMVHEFKQKKLASSNTSHRAVVLDLFAGVGTGIVVLKRLGIGMKKVIHVEIDKVATHVYRENHDPSYNPNLKNDGIEHVCVPSFEELERNLEKFLREHGPIDIIIASPPCGDFSEVNASRQGLEGNEGQYMLGAARMITRIQERQLKDLFYMIENVPLKNDKELPLAHGDLEQVKQVLGMTWDPVHLDAAYFSPCRRDRVFFTNTPIDSHKMGDGPLFELSTCGLLEDGFRLPSHVVEPGVIVKANTFMASKVRVNDERMLVCKKSEHPAAQGRYEFRFFTLKERADMMGYPNGYFDPVRDLFTKVTSALQKHTKWFGSWRDDLEKRLHYFSGAYNGHSNPFTFEIGLKNDLVVKLYHKKQHFNVDEYAKHLVGNAFSIPVVEHILKVLVPFFPQVEYHDLTQGSYWYNYIWEEKQEDKPERFHNNDSTLQDVPKSSDVYRLDDWEEEPHDI